MCSLFKFTQHAGALNNICINTTLIFIFYGQDILILLHPISFSLSPLVIQKCLGMSHFLSSAPPFIFLHCLLFYSVFQTALFLGPCSKDIFNLCLLLLNANEFLTYRETFVHMARVPSSTPSIFSVLHLFLLSFLSPSLHSVILAQSLYPLTDVLRSIRPPLFCPAAQ